MKPQLFRSFALAVESSQNNGGITTRLGSIISHTHHDVPRYAYWLYKVPTFGRRNRWTSMEWNSWDGRHYRIEEVSGHSRETLCRLAEAENSMLLSVEQLQTSKAHEQGLNRHIADQYCLDFLSWLIVKPLLDHNSEISMVSFLLSTSPPHIQEPLAQYYQRCRELGMRILHDARDLHELHLLMRCKLNGATFFREEVASFDFVKRHKELRADARVSARNSRAALKENLGKGKYVGHQLRLGFSRINAEARIPARQTLQRLLDSRDAHLISCYNARPLRWYYNGFHLAYARISSTFNITCKHLVR
jgi:hypothetical protein